MNDCSYVYDNIDFMFVNISLKIFMCMVLPPIIVNNSTIYISMEVPL